MKKRRPCTWNQNRSPKNSPRLAHIRGFESFPVKTKSSQDLKRRRLQRGGPKSQKKNGEYNDKLYLKRDDFGSLESLFDVKKPVILPEVHALTFASSKERYAVPSFELRGLTKLKGIETDILNRARESAKYSSNYTIEKSEELERETHEPVTTESEARADSSVEARKDLRTSMAEAEEETTEEVMEVVQAIPEEEEEEAATDKDLEDIATESAADDVVTDKGLEATIQDIAEGAGDEMQGDGEPPPYPMPPGIGEGVPIKTGGHRESILSSSPLTDTAVVNEMKEADERCAVIAREIEQLKREISELANKKDLTEEDTVIIQGKQDDIMSKLAEFEQITRKLQRLLGLSDPSSYTFAKMFDMLPYPHSKPDVTIIEEPIEEQTDSKRELAEDEQELQDSKLKTEDEDKLEEEHFDLPSAEYSEDQLPRVIVCGYTEDEIPKIIVADSERKGKQRCLQTLTGKLTESLTMQERLVKENAQLEGGKYKLEEALLEKDSAVESLQRKVCGLQAEMRIVVKENTEMSRQLAGLNQRVASPTCCYTCTGDSSPAASSPHPLHPYTYSSSLQQSDDCCRCKCCPQPQLLSPVVNNVCVSPDEYGSATGCGSPRLGGGASRSGGCCVISSASSQTGEMCCRSPATVKTPCPEQPQRGACPAELEDKLTIYGNSTKQLEQQLGSMESEVRNMQIELANVQRERQQLEQQRKLLKCTGPCAPCACRPPPTCNFQPPTASAYATPAVPSPIFSPPLATSVPPMPLAKDVTHAASTTCTGPCTNAPMGTSTCPQQQLRDLREQYARLQDDYKNKLCEVSCLRADSEKLKQEARDAKEDKEKMEIKLIDTQERLKLLEAEKEKYEGYKEQMVEQEQALLVAKQRFREAQDELEELRSLIQDQATQLEDYRNKYLQAQQQVEEQRRQLDLMEMDNARMNENVTLEIGRVKSQFQEKLAELAPLPDILKQTQVKLQEAQQMRLVAERNCEDLSRELLGCKDKIQTLQNQLDVLRNEHQALQEERGHGSGRFDELERKNSELRHENERMKNTLARFEEHEAQLQKRIDEKMHEITQLTAMLEQVREDSARQVARTKERCDTIRRTMQGQIAEMERQLAQCRATARAAQKDRDEIRQKMQGQINNLNEAFEQAQGRIRSLQGHVNYLRTSYSNIFKGQGETPTTVLHGDTPGAGYDSCDCNY